jgi:anti-sigma factor RsiW
MGPWLDATVRGMSAPQPELACQEIVELVTAYLEGGLPAEDRERFEEHVLTCGQCEEYVAQVRRTIALAGRVDAADLSPEAQASLLDAFRAWRRR